MDSRLLYLEREMTRTTQSLEQLQLQHNLLQRFIHVEFGTKFQKFYEESEQYEEGDEGIKPEGEEESYADEDYDEENQGNVEFVGGEDDDNPEGNNLQIYEDEDDEVDEEEEEVACPSQMVAVEFEDDGDVDMEEQRLQQQQKSGQNRRTISRNFTQQIQPNVPVQVVKKPSEGQSSSSRSIRPPPPLLKRPPGPPQLLSRTTTNSNRGNNSQNVNPQRVNPPPQRISTNGSNGVLKINHAECIGTGNGKYAKYYRKVDAELIQCKICNKILKRRGKFIQHLRTHTGEKPFVCEFCQASFSRKDNMNVHMQRHHSGPDPYNNQQQASGKAVMVCQICKSEFWRQTDLNIHLQQAHGYTLSQEDEEEEEYYEDEEEAEDDV